MVNSTTNYSFNLPEVNSAVDEDLWGGQLNTNWTDLDSILNTRQFDYDFADFKITSPVLEDYAEEIQSLTLSSNTITVDFENGNHASVTLDDDLTTITINNVPPTGDAAPLVLYITQDNTGGHTVTFPSSFRWAGGTAPTITSTADRTDIFVAITRDGGTTYAATIYGQNFDLT